MKKLEELGISKFPWELNNHRTFPYVGSGIVIDPDGNWIAEVNGDDGKMLKANARIIAAAPELYSALYEAIVEKCNGCDHCGADPDYKCSRENGECFVHRWRAALSKAGEANYDC